MKESTKNKPEGVQHVRSGRLPTKTQGALSPEVVQRKALRGQALELRKAGATYQAIADRLGIALTTAYKYVREGVQDIISEPAEELRVIHYERLNHMLIAIWPRAQKGELPAVDRVIGIMDRIARLYGIEAPQTSYSESREVIVIDGGKADYIAGLKALKQTHTQNFKRVGPDVGPIGGPQNESLVFEEYEDGSVEGVIDVEEVEEE